MSNLRRAGLSDLGQTREPAVVTGQPRVHRPPIPVPDVRDGRGSRRVRIMQKGWETFTGNFGGVDFIDGVTTDLISEAFADRVCTQIRAVDADTGASIGPQQRMIDAKTVKMPVAERLKPAPTTKEEQLEADAAAVEQAAETQTKQERVVYTYDQLAKIVDRKGIQGLRDIAAPYGVRARAIPDLITNILNAQAEAQGLGPVVKA